VTGGVPRKDVIDKLRTMIKEMESQKPRDLGEVRLPPVPRIGYGTPSALGSKSIPSTPVCAPVTYEVATGDVRNRSNLGWRSARTLVPSEITTEDSAHFRVIRSVYPSGSENELRLPPEEALPALRSIEPGLTGFEDWLYLDIETTGLAGAATVAFLAGFGEWVGDEFHVTQLFLTERSFEEFFMEEIGNRLAGRRTLVTFNGKAFDVPVLWSRFTMCGMRPPQPPAVHLDLLSLVRNMGKRPEYGQSLKEAIRRFTGAVRDGDIPGHLIPALYFIYERDGDASILEPVLKHNRLDVVDMVCLVRVLCQVVSGDPVPGDAYALGGAGKLHLRKGNLELARRCLETALSGSAGAGDSVTQNRTLGHVLRKQGDWQGAMNAFAKVVASGCAKDEDFLWFARSWEMGPGDIGRSRDIVVEAVSRYEALGKEPPLSLQRRLRRLEKRMKSAK